MEYDKLLTEKKENDAIQIEIESNKIAIEKLNKNLDVVNILNGGISNYVR